MMTQKFGNRVGIEVGGTFTDLVEMGPDGITIAKVPSVPARPDEGAIAALQAAGTRVSDLSELVHGSTVATNAVLERKGERIAFVVTRGYRDILLLARHDRLAMFDLFYRKPEPVVSRTDIFEVEERILADGGIETALDVEATETALSDFLGAGDFGAVAVCLLNAYADPRHEQQIRNTVARRFPDLPVTCSSEVNNEFREYERASTTTLSAYIQPVINGYLDRFEKELSSFGFAGHLSIMQSNGGRIPADAIRRSAITTLLSGPAAGVIGAVRQAGRSGFRDLITLDIGGTSADVCLVSEGRPDLVGETHIHGLPVRTPVVDIVTVGAGGGSIVWSDAGNMLRIGPTSAGADPGPACYGKGGREPTLTDAQLLRGALRPEALLAGNMALHLDLARRALTPLAERFGMSLEIMADSAVRLANANVVSAIKTVSTERGRDPRDYALVAFGGAGALHATQVAEELNIASVVVPPCSGVLSAFGLLAADYLLIESLTRRTPIEAGAPDAVREVYGELRRKLEDRFAALQLEGEVAAEFSADMRFVGQAFEIRVPLATEALMTLTQEDLEAAFAEEHRRIYHHGGGGGAKPIEIISFRLGLSALLPELPGLRSAESPAPTAERTATVVDGGRELDCPVLARGTIAPAAQVMGPAIIEETTSTIFISPDWVARRDGADNLLIERI